MMIETGLLQRLRSLDEQALIEVYDAYNTEIFRYACGLLGSPDIAEECVAETFHRLLLALSNRGGPNDHLRAYLYRIAHNWICDQSRRQPLPELELDERLPAEPYEQTCSTQGSDPARAAVDVLEKERLRLAILRLTEDQRQVVTLKYLAGLDNDEIAEALQKPVGAVKSLQVRGLAALRRMLTAHELENAPDSPIERNIKDGSHEFI